MAEDAAWSARYLASESSGSFKVTVLSTGGVGDKMEKNAGSTKNGVQEEKCGEKSDRKYICSSDFTSSECLFCGQNEDTNLFFG